MMTPALIVLFLPPKVNALRELQVKGGEELRSLFGRTLTTSPCGMASVLDRVFYG